MVAGAEVRRRSGRGSTVPNTNALRTNPPPPTRRGHEMSETLQMRGMNEQRGCTMPKKKEYRSTQNLNQNVAHAEEQQVKRECEGNPMHRSRRQNARQRKRSHARCLLENASEKRYMSSPSERRRRENSMFCREETPAMRMYLVAQVLRVPQRWCPVGANPRRQKELLLPMETRNRHRAGKDARRTTAEKARRRQ